MSSSQIYEQHYRRLDASIPLRAQRWIPIAREGLKFWRGCTEIAPFDWRAVPFATRRRHGFRRRYARNVTCLSRVARDRRM